MATISEGMRRGLGPALDRYRGLVENAVEGIFQTTPEGRYLMANRTLARIYGYDDPEELIARLTDIAHQLYVDAARREEFVRILQAEDSVLGFESQVYRRDGRVIWISECARAVRTLDGRLLGFEGTVEDITRRKRAEHERAQVLADLEIARSELEIRVHERTAELADANTALRAEVAERRRAEEELAAAHRELAASVAEKKRFYRELVRCVTKGRFHLVDAATIPDPGTLLLEHTLNTFKDEPPLRHALRRTATSAGMSTRAVDDLELATGEAATNAIKHGVQGCCRVHYRESSGHLVVTVSDRGNGIRADDLPATILLPGFSKAVSLGMGYTLMLELVDRIWLATERDGTVVQLEKRVGPEPEPKDTEMGALFAAWDRL